MILPSWERHARTRGILDAGQMTSSSSKSRTESRTLPRGSRSPSTGYAGQGRSTRTLPASPISSANSSSAARSMYFQNTPKRLNASRRSVRGRPERSTGDRRRPGRDDARAEGCRVSIAASPQRSKPRSGSEPPSRSPDRASARPAFRAGTAGSCSRAAAAPVGSW